MKAVLDIVNLVAKNSTLSKVTRLISPFKVVVNCRRKKDEKLSLFIDRFRGLAAKHLPHANASSVSQTDQVLAITLLHNDDLSKAVLTSAKLELISLATKRAHEDLVRELRTISIGLLEPVMASVRTVKEELTALANLGSSIRASRECSRSISSNQERFGTLKSPLRSTYDCIDPPRRPSIAEMFKSP